MNEPNATAPHPKPCTCEIRYPGTKNEYRALDRACPRHGDEGGLGAAIVVAALLNEHRAVQASPLMRASRVIAEVANRSPHDFRWTDVTVDQHGNVLIVAADWPSAFDAAATLGLIPGNPVSLGPADDQQRAVMVWSGTVSDVRVDISVTYRPGEPIRQADGAARSFVTENLEVTR